MRIRKAVITAAGLDQDRLPLQRFVDLDGQEKTALRIIVEEVVSAGVEQICVVVRRGSHQAYLDAAGDFARSLVFVEQPAPRGYGEALWRAAQFVGDQPFVHLVSDHLYISRAPRRCAQQLVEMAQAQQCSVSAVQPTRESMLAYYGAVGGSRVAGRGGLYQIDRVIEKPTPTKAEQELVVPGLRAGHYLCLFGMHVFTPAIMELLGRHVAADGSSDRGIPIMLSPALAELAKRERYLALELEGTRYNIGVKYGMLMAQLALALCGGDREEILARLVELLASRDEERGTGGSRGNRGE
jgi:UTP--glucose-1-phosphate uridylyltransferase